MAHLKDYFSLVKFTHTAFALPFALVGYTMGVGVAGFNPWVLVGVVVCMIFARNAAMGFNRLVDRKFDAENPRTAQRELPTGKVSVREVKWFVGTNALGFLAVAAAFNWLTFIMAPVVLLVVLGYSLTKRFTALCHMVLGLGLAIAPVGAYIAVTGTVAAGPLLLSLLVFTWVAGFDIIYALQDEEFDREQQLYSIPATLGLRGALWVALGLHAVTAVGVVALGFLASVTGLFYWCGAAVFLGLLVYQHLVVRIGGLQRIGAMFGLVNGLASMAYAALVIVGLLLGR